MRRSQSRRTLASVVPYAEALARKIAARYPGTRFVLTDSEGPHDPYCLYVLYAPHNEDLVWRLTSLGQSDLLIEHGIDISVLPFSRQDTPKVLPKLKGEGVVEITVTKDAA